MIIQAKAIYQAAGFLLIRLSHFLTRPSLFGAYSGGLCPSQQHTLLHSNIAQLAPSGNNTDATIGWTLNSMVVGPFEALQTLGINRFENERFDLER